MLRNHDEPFDVPRDALHAALVRYVRSKPAYYKDVVDDAASHEVRATLTLGYFAYRAEVRFAVTSQAQGSKLAIQVKTSPLFFIDPLDFWGRYCRRVVTNLRAQMAGA